MVAGPAPMLHKIPKARMGFNGDSTPSFTRGLQRFNCLKPSQRAHGWGYLACSLQNLKLKRGAVAWHKAGMPSLCIC